MARWAIGPNREYKVINWEQFSIFNFQFLNFLLEISFISRTRVKDWRKTDKYTNH